MKNISFETVRKYLMGLAVFWIATGERLGNIPLVVFAAIVLFDVRLWKDAFQTKRLQGRELLFFPSLLLFLHSLSYYLFSDPVEVGSLIQVRAAFGLIPLIIFLLADRIQGWGRTFLLNSLFSGLLITALYGFGLAWWRAAHRIEPSFSFSDYFFYDRYSFPLGWHPAYMSLFAGLLMMWFAMERFLPSAARSVFKLRAGLGLLFCAALFFILQGRMNWIALMLSLPVVFFTFKKELMPTAISPKLWLASGIGFALSVGLFMWKAPDSIRTRWSQGISTEYNLASADIEDFSGFTIRLAEWEGVRHALARAPFYGYGADAQRELEKSYAEIGFVLGQKNRYNAHSMYYQSLLAGGWIGLVVLLFFVGSLLVYALQNRDPLLFAAVLFFALSGLTESLADRQKGVLFAAVILPLLAVSFEGDRSPKRHKKS